MKRVWNSEFKMPRLVFEQLVEPRASDSGKCVIGIHGMLGCRKSMVALCKGLDANGVFVVDLPGHGESPLMEKYSVSNMARELLRDLRDLQSTLNLNFYLIGHSLGGQVAMAAAVLSARFSVKIAGVCSIDISPVNYFSDKNGLPEVCEGNDIVTLMKTLVTNACPPPGKWSDVVATLASATPPVPIQFIETLKEVYSPAQNGEDKGLWKMDVSGLENSLRCRDLAWDLQAVDEEGSNVFYGSALVIQGSNSPWVEESLHSEALRSFLPNFVVETIAGAGHSPQKDKPEATRDAIQRSLREV